ncbi:MULTISPECIES: hypothetical protein [Bacillaceae]|uniref:hypothetical protein n=1 Tax=Bacillaceae TaxID=186817 RepID=UPI000BFD67BE|nr:MULTISPECIES: hypothetical protein [Bacillaceae]PGT78087.1 hypothetical protein COD11_24205 [Bacillus sp. AFS040349]UGB32841.1 hypothetical protein LPC09_10620 [Metabacillus sp. B2-18]
MKRTKIQLPFLAIFLFVLMPLFKKLINKNPHKPNEEHEKYPLYIRKVLRNRIFTFNDNEINELSKMDVLNTFLSDPNVTFNGTTFRKAIKDIFGLNLIEISNDGEGARLSIYPEEIMTGVTKALDQKARSFETDQHIMTLKKAEVMDLYLSIIPNYSLEDLVRTINLVYGINLPGISSLEHARISLYTKSQWLIKNDHDLVVIYTGKGDIDVRVYPTPLLSSITGSSEFPDELKNKLISLGYQHNQVENEFYYCSPNNESVPNLFKEKTIKTICAFIDRHFNHK